MNVSKILSEIDSEIARLQRARAALSAIDGAPVATAGRRGRPKGSKNVTKAPAKAPAKTPAKKKAKRTLSPEGRKRIQEAMKRRWAERKKESK